MIINNNVNRLINLQSLMITFMFLLNTVVTVQSELIEILNVVRLSSIVWSNIVGFSGEVSRGKWSSHANIELINTYYLCFRESLFSHVIVIRKPSSLSQRNCPLQRKYGQYSRHSSIWLFLLQFRRFWRSVWPITSRRPWGPGIKILTKTHAYNYLKTTLIFLITPTTT